MTNNGSAHNRYDLYVFDLDHTLLIPENSPTFRASGEAYIWMEGRKAMLEDLHRQSKQIAICSNQGGIAAGHLEWWETVEAIHTRLSTLSFYVPWLICPYVAGYGAGSERWRAYAPMRKPSPLMNLMLAAQFPQISPREVLCIGDRKDDQMSADFAGFDFAWIGDFMLPWIGRPAAEESPF